MVSWMYAVAIFCTDPDPGQTTTTSALAASQNFPQWNRGEAVGIRRGVGGLAA